MNTPNSPRPHDPYAALRHRDYLKLLSANLFLSAGLLIQTVALGYAVYRMTRDPLSLGLIGLAEAIPFIGLALFGGYLADRYEKTRLMQLAGAVVALGSLVLIVVTLPSTRAHLSQTAVLAVIYAVIFLIGLARGIYSPASSALRAFLVPRELYGNAASWSSTFQEIGAIGAPVSAGFLYAGFGLTTVLCLVLAMVLLNATLLWRIPPRPMASSAAAAGELWQSLAEGLRYVWRTKILLYSISLDLFSVLFGGVVAILPVFAEDVLQVGPQGLGVLRAAPAIGALLTVLACAWYPPTRHPWRNLLIAVAGFGAATLVFGLSEWFWLSAAALFLTGAFDAISVVLRNTLVQVLTADHMRGRVGSVNSIFISASNELGAFESGLAARLLGTVPSVVMGACATLLIVGGIWRKSRDLLKVRI